MPNRIEITENHPLAKGDSGLSLYVVGSFIEEDEESLRLYVRNFFLKNQLQDPESDFIKKIAEISGKTDISIIVNADLFKEREIAETTGRPKQQIFPDGMAPSPQYTSAPPLISKCNESAYKAVEQFLENNAKGFLFVTGSVGTGKSHLLHYMAAEARKRKRLFYLNNLSGFIDQLKLYFSRKDRFVEIYNDCDFFIIDEFQGLNKPYNEGYFAPIFEILNNLMLNARSIIISSDKPMNWYTLLPDRLLSRMKSGYQVEISMPDIGMKEQFIQRYEEANGYRFPQEIRVMLLQFQDLRSLHGAMLFSTPGLPGAIKELDALILRIKSLNASSSNLGDNYEKALMLLMEYFGVETLNSSADRKSKDKKKQYTPRNQGRCRAVLYYLFRDITPEHLLVKHFQMDRRRKTDTYEYGKKNFDAIQDENLRNVLRRLTEVHQQETMLFSNLT